MTTLATEAKRDAQREIIRQSFTDIVEEIRTALREAGLNHPMFLTVPHNGLSLMTIATPIDPPDDDWSRMTEIACQILGKKLEITVANRSLLCAAISTTMSATELTIGPIRQ